MCEILKLKKIFLFPLINSRKKFCDKIVKKAFESEKFPLSVVQYVSIVWKADGVE